MDPGGGGGVVGGGGGGGGVVGGGGGGVVGGWHVLDFTQRGHATESPSLSAVQLEVSRMFSGSLPDWTVQQPKQSQFLGVSAAQ
jgi:hypothetical protein